MIRLIDVFDVVDNLDCVLELYKDKMINAMVASLISSRTTSKISTSSIIKMIWNVAVILCYGFVDVLLMFQII